MKNVFVIAIDEFAGYEVGTTEEKTITNVLSHFGAWTDESKAKEKCFDLNQKEFIPEDDSPQGEGYYVLPIEINGNLFEEIQKALELASKLNTSQDCPQENHGVVIAAMDILDKLK